MPTTLIAGRLAGLALVGSLAAPAPPGDEPRPEVRVEVRTQATTDGAEAPKDAARVYFRAAQAAQGAGAQAEAAAARAAEADTRSVQGQTFYRTVPLGEFQQFGAGQTFTWTTLPALQPAGPTLRAQLGLPDDQGLVVVRVQPDETLGRAGVKEHDILMKLDDAPLSRPQELLKKLGDAGDGVIVLKLLRGGKEKTVEIRAEDRKEAKGSGYWIGTPVADADETLRSHLDLPAGSLVITEVVPDSPAAKAGLKKNDILVEVGGEALKGSESLVKQVQASGGKPLSIKLVRGGKAQTVEVTPQPRPGDGANQAHALEVFTRAVPAQVQGQVERELRLVRPGVVVAPNAEHLKALERLHAVQGLTTAKGGEDKLDQVLDQLKKLRGEVDELRKALPAKGGAREE